MGGMMVMHEMAGVKRLVRGGLLLLLLTLCMSAAAQAVSLPDAKSAIPLKLVGGNEEEGYRYEQAGTGIGFDSLVTMDSSDSCWTLFEIDDGAYYELWRDGEKIPYNSEDLIFEEGDFQLLLAPSERQRNTNYSIFPFHLQELILVLDPDTITMSYVRTYEMFGFSGDGQPLFMLSVPNGGVSTETVTFAIVSREVSVEDIYLNAERQDDLTQREFSKPGSYLLNLRIGAFSSYWLTFRVLPYLDCTMTFLPLPDGVTCLSSSDAVLTRTTLCLPRDGAYQLRFSCAASGADMVWDQTLVRDTTLPGVCFSENVGSGQVHRKMRVTALSPDAELTVYRDDLPQFRFDGSFEEDGRYRVVVSDRAGNTQELLFSIYQLERFFLTGAGLIGLLVVLFIVSKIKLDRAAQA
jgi:hypothetical protein